MSKYLNLYQTKAEADAAMYAKENTPNVSYCEEGESVKYTEQRKDIYEIEIWANEECTIRPELGKQYVFNENEISSSPLYVQVNQDNLVDKYFPDAPTSESNIVVSSVSHNAVSLSIISNNNYGVRNGYSSNFCLMVGNYNLYFPKRYYSEYGGIYYLNSKKVIKIEKQSCMNGGSDSIIIFNSPDDFKFGSII